MKYIKNVAIFGSHSIRKNSKIYQEVFNVAKRLAENKLTVVNGGGPGLMEAASFGAHAAGGKAIGVTYYPHDLKNFEGKDKNNILDKEIKTNNYIERTLTLLKYGDAYIIFKGGTGTISEFGMAWGLAKLYFGHHKPLILYGKFWFNIMKAIEVNLEIDEQEKSVYGIATKPEEVISMLEKIEEKMESIRHKKHEGPFRL